MVDSGRNEVKTDSTIRLDLGAGDKIEPGWLRVDFQTERKILREGEAAREMLKGGEGNTYNTDPDIACDLRAIPLPDDYADVARAIHVIEHFYPWEALPLLQEWLRVLKPGAELIIECPCFEKIMALCNVPEIPPNYTHWGLFGDPRYADPLMMHKWCYSTKQMLRLFAQAGFCELRAEPPKFHVPVRDLRVVGQKPVPEKLLVAAN